MNSPETDPLLRLESLWQEQKTLEGELQAAPERLRPTYEVAAKAAQTAIHECLQSDPVRQQISAQEEQLDQDIGVVETLAQKGLLTGQQAETELERIMRHEDYRLLRIAKRLGGATLQEKSAHAVEAPAKKAAIPSSTPGKQAAHTTLPAAIPAKAENSQDHEILKDTVDVVFTETATIVNDTTYPDTIHGASKDRRKTLFTALAMFEGSASISVNDLWDIAFPGQPFRRDDMQIVRNWFSNYLVGSQSNQPLIQHNGKRGPASAYVIQPNMAFSITDTTTGQRATQSSPAAESLKSREDYTKVPTIEEMRLMRAVVVEMAEQLGSQLDPAVFNPAINKAPDFTGKSARDITRMQALTILRIRTIADCKGTSMQIFRDTQQHNTALLGFLDTITPIIKQHLPMLDRKNLRRIAAEAINRYRA